MTERRGVQPPPAELLGAAPDRAFGCVKGHEFKAKAPFTISFGFSTGQVRTGPLCPECLVMALDIMASAKETTP